MLLAPNGQCDCVDREVTTREIGLDRAVHGSEVDGSPTGAHDSPRGVLFGEREGGAARALRIGPRRIRRFAAHDVDVDHLPAEQLVADSTADEPRFLVRKHLAHELIHRRPSCEPAADRTRPRRRARS